MIYDLVVYTKTRTKTKTITKIKQNKHTFFSFNKVILLHDGVKERLILWVGFGLVVYIVKDESRLDEIGYASKLSERIR
jgi:hypothetical protein